MRVGFRVRPAHLGGPEATPLTASGEANPRGEPCVLGERGPPFPEGRPHAANLNAAGVAGSRGAGARGAELRQVRRVW